MAVYIIRVGDTNYWKIGYTANEKDGVVKRLKSGQCWHYEKLSIYYIFENAPQKLEEEIHNKLRGFNGNGGEECFCIEEEVLIELINLAIEKGEIDYAEYARYYQEKNKTERDFGYYVRPISRGQQNPIDGRGQDVLYKRDQRIVLTGTKSSILPVGKEYI